MGLAYLFALVVGLGILLIQVFLGSKDADGDFDKHLDFDADGDADFDAEAHLDVDADADADADAHADDGGDHADGGMGVATLFLSTRFWIFAALGFGLCGSLLHYLLAVQGLTAAITASVMGLASGLGAAWTFRALKRTASRHTESAESAVTRVGRILVPVTRDNPGKVRIELGGQTVDLVARSDDEEIARGESVVIHEVEGKIAYVTRVPDDVA